MKKIHLFSQALLQVISFNPFSATKSIGLVFLLLAFPWMIKAQWEVYVPGFADTIGISDVDVVNENVIWAVGVRLSVTDSTYGYDVPGDAYFARTSDGGATWTTGTLPMAAPGHIPFIANMTALDALTAYVIGLDDFGSAKTLETIDGGSSWQVLNVGWDPVVSWPDYIYAFSPAKLTMIGDPRDGEFEIFTTGSGGMNWMKINGSNIPDPLPGEFGFNNCGDAMGNDIWFGTSAGRVYHSNNSGNSWEVHQTPIPFIGLISMSDPQHGIITYGYQNFNVNPDYRIWATSDGCQSWTEITPLNGQFANIGFDYIPNSSYIILTMTRHGYQSGPFETWISPDSGINWNQIDSGNNPSWLDFIDSSTGWGGGWQQLSHPTRMFEYTGSPLVGLFTPNAIEAEVLICPNPTADIVQLAVKTKQANDFLVLLNDSPGNLLKSEKVSNTADFQLQLDLAGYPAGVYILTVSTKEGHLSRSVVKQ